MSDLKCQLYNGISEEIMEFVEEAIEKFLKNHPNISWTDLREKLLEDMKFTVVNLAIKYDDAKAKASLSEFGETSGDRNQQQ